jgi:hypothetical protein
VVSAALLELELTGAVVLDDGVFRAGVARSPSR